MPLSLALEAAPLQVHTDGVVRVGGTRVTLDTVIAAFNEGLSAEGIAEQYPSLRLADIYSAVAYVLNHRKEIDEYLIRRQAEAVAIRDENERRFNPSGIRARLLARRG